MEVSMGKRLEGRAAFFRDVEKPRRETWGELCGAQTDAAARARQDLIDDRLGDFAWCPFRRGL
jgi:hypothetical protein